MNFYGLRNMNEDSRHLADDLRGVGEYVANTVDQYETLDADKDDRAEVFLEVISKSLSSGEIKKSTKNGGVYIDIYSPEYDGKQLPFITKVLKIEKDSKARDYLSDWLSEIDNAEFQAILDNTELIFLQNRDKGVKFENLNDAEKLLVVLAWEHQRHEELYGPYIVPAVFVSFIAKNEVSSDQPVVRGSKNEYVLESQKEWSDLLKDEGKLTKDGKEIYINKGSTVYAMVQNFKRDLSPSVFRLPDDYPVTEEMITQIEDLANIIEKKFQETNYFPDPYMSHNNSNNLKFTKDGKLLLIDSNSLRKKNSKDRYGDDSFVVSELRHLVTHLRNKLAKIDK